MLPKQVHILMCILYVYVSTQPIDVCGTSFSWWLFLRSRVLVASLSTTCTLLNVHTSFRGSRLFISWINRQLCGCPRYILQSRILSISFTVFDMLYRYWCMGIWSINEVCLWWSPSQVLKPYVQVHLTDTCAQHASICYLSCDQELLRYSVIRILPTLTVICTAIIVTFHRWTTNVAYLLDVTPRNPLPHQYHLQLFLSVHSTTAGCSDGGCPIHTVPLPSVTSCSSPLVPTGGNSVGIEL